MKNYCEQLVKIHQKIDDLQCDWLLINNSNQFFLEYLPPQQQLIAVITGFTGSNALLLISKKAVIFFTDGRYLLQAKQQVILPNLEIIDLAQISLIEKIANIVTKDQILAIDGDSFNITEFNKINNRAIICGFEIKIFNRQILIDLFADSLSVWQQDPSSIEKNYLIDNNKIDNNLVFFLNEQQSGESYDSKCQRLLKNCSIACEGNSSNSAILINHPEDVAWLLNIRGAELAETPIIFASALILSCGKILLFVDNIKIKQSLDFLASSNKLSNLQIYYHDNMIKVIYHIIDKNEIDKIFTEENTIGILLYQQLITKVNIVNKPFLITNLRSIKNDIEIAGAITTHKIDAVAMIKFLHWLEISWQKQIAIDEMLASSQLYRFRQENQAFFGNSFATISAFASNGSIIHYRSNSKTNLSFKENSLYLVDSGGQYCGDDFIGTTDITRTIAIGNPNSEMIENYTRVLKGHIALASAKFPRSNVANQFDILARYHLWYVNKDYAHGTGHGVGSFLGVHEGPFAINKRSIMPLVPRLILSNEPGFYCDNQYGIRLENLMLVVESDIKDWLEFKILTLVPFDLRLIDLTMLTYKEKLWLKNYHQRIINEITPILSPDLANWLKEKLIPAN